jgi:hypothetical protein
MMMKKDAEENLFEKEFPLSERDKMQRDYCISGSEEEIKEFMFLVWQAARKTM